MKTFYWIFHGLAYIFPQFPVTFFFFNFIFGWAGSLLPHVGFLQLWGVGAVHGLLSVMGSFVAEHRF